MAKSLSGLDLQVAIAGHLKSNGFKLQEEEEWDHVNKIDFVITKFPHYPKSISLGVQITGWCGNTEKIREFVSKNVSGKGNLRVAPKSIYLEIEDDVDINRGGADLAAHVLYAFQFDERFAETEIGGATIQAKKDAIAFRFFDPINYIGAESLPAAINAVVPTPVPNLKASVDLLKKKLVTGTWELEGTLSSFYSERRFGFIRAQDGKTYHLHISNIADSTLSLDLSTLPKSLGATRVGYHVLFEDGGKTHPDANYNTAKNVRLLAKC
jgi:hypothetical protein